MLRAGAAHAAIAWETAGIKLAHLGKTLILVPLPLFAGPGVLAMYSLFAQIARFFPARPPAVRQPGIARKLMESAGARAGSDPRQAQQLREAAFAFLRVVR